MRIRNGIESSPSTLSTPYERPPEREREHWRRENNLLTPFSLNAQIDYIPFTLAIHRLNGIVTPASAAYSAQELEHQLRSSGSKALFTCAPLLDVALTAAKAAGIPDDAIFLLPIPTPNTETTNKQSTPPYPTIDDLVAEGEALPEVEPLKWVKGQATRQPAYLCYSSGTSGMPVSSPSSEVWLLHSPETNPSILPWAESRHDLPPKHHGQHRPIMHLRRCRSRQEGHRDPGHARPPPP